MAARSEYVEWVCERLAPLGTIRAKAMFGGWGLYCDGFFFALIADEVLYVKVDAQSRAEFEVAGLAPFTYAMKDGRQQSLNYFSLPEAALDEEAVMLAWARKGLAAALRAPRKA